MKWSLFKGGTSQVSTAIELKFKEQITLIKELC